MVQIGSPSNGGSKQFPDRSINLSLTKNIRNALAFTNTLRPDIRDKNVKKLT